MVIVKEDDITNYLWPLARISEVIPGEGGLVRVVKYLTKLVEKLAFPHQSMSPAIGRIANSR